MDISSMKNYASIHDVPIMKDDGIAFLCEFIRDNGLKDILELGTAIGYSAIQMAKVHPDIKIITLEIDANRAESARKNIEDQLLTSRIEVVTGNALDYKTSQTFDFIFIDAAKSQSRRYLNHFKGNLRDGGYIAIDNLNFHGMVDHPEITDNRSTRQMVSKIRKFRDSLKEDQEWITDFYKEVGDGVCVLRRKLK